MRKGLFLNVLISCFFLAKCGDDPSKNISDIPNKIEETQVIQEKEEVYTTDAIDLMLDHYERYLEEHIVFMKMIKEGDVSAYSDLEDSMQIADDLNKKIEDTRAYMTPEQTNRMRKIIDRMNEAVATLL